ncbi:enoyl-ACP reductase FabI [Amphiplicatus metriothermophilus]|uniref:Enoyl-[acyl-carrier-protein] reductase [NADH] n=1 Tax=Amphiplicatus metriothermophilus TaxID=1519374 RepID=A0A239PLZ9_9PROT|nr:enoyl-ACP reductase [Amphiplicatus metriothermophilus]MBB5517541.1 enoyl-[acyl-carrier protein] reductase I [Amphiplicatus metriothermophilus]SNT68124.1 Enoyl-[acyl-carrier-protein] reductase [NADH] [Amphiplicatus metriothermophilus]
MSETADFPSGDLMKGKRGLVMGVANKNSIAWAIARQLHAQGAEIAFTYLNEAMERRVRPLAESLGAPVIVECDVTSDESMDKAFAAVAAAWTSIDFLVHAIAFTDKAALEGSFVENTTRQNFKDTMDVSAFSFVDAARRAARLMPNGGSMITLTYLGSERTVPNYNVMGVAKAALEASMRYIARDLGPRGVRVNAVSAGPVKTLAAAGISSGRHMLSFNRKASPLREDTDVRGVAGAALYLLSDLGRSCTGETLHVDAGFHIVGMPDEDALAE